MTNELYQMCHDGTLGRYLIATENLEPGAVVVQEDPLVRGPFLHTAPLCLACYKLLNEHNCRPCSKCGWPVCNDTCEKSPNHQPECVLTAAKGTPINIKHFGIPNPNYQFVSILRALHLKKTNPDKWHKLQSLQSHPNPNIAPAAFMCNLFKLRDWTEEEVQHIGGVMMVNAHELPFSQPPQLAIYADVSFLEHNCKANCSKTFTDDGDIKIVASETIKQGDHLSICYTDAFWGAENRRRHLHESKSFWCLCARCEDSSEFGTHLNSLKCPKRTCGGFVLPKTFLEESSRVWICNECDYMFPQENIGIILGKIGEEMSEITAGDAMECKEFIRKHEKVLAPLHYYLVDVKMALCFMLDGQNVQQLSAADLRLLHDLSLELKQLIERVAPAERRILGATIYRLAKSKLEMARRSDSTKTVLAEWKELLTEAGELLSEEPNILPEGRIRRQIALDLQLVDDY